MFSFLLGLIGAIVAIVGWMVFHSPVAVFFGTGLYLIETLLEWKALNLNAKKLELSILVIGCVVGLFLKSIPWYICGMLAVNIYSIIIGVVAVVFL